MFIRRIALRNFKSFGNANVQFEKGISCVIGPNGSGKSNIIDALLFAFGETSLKSMRVKKTSDLIFKAHNVAEVTMDFEDAEKKHELKRLVRKDGKTKYMLDGKRTKKYVIEEFLAKHRMSTHTILKQGEVQRIVEMNATDRRSLIDYAANISEYEQKKKEAMNELEQAEKNLREANAVLNERRGYLDELKSDREQAIAYLALKKRFDALKATTLLLELKSYEKNFEVAVNNVLDLGNKIDAVRAGIAQRTQEIDAQLAEREKINQQIMQSGEGKQIVLQQEIETLERDIARMRNEIANAQTELKTLEDKKSSFTTLASKAKAELDACARNLQGKMTEIKTLEEILSEETKSYDKLMQDSKTFSSSFQEARVSLEKYNADMLACKDQLNALQANVSLSKEKKSLKQKELERLKIGFTDDIEQKRKELESRMKVAKQAVKDEVLNYDRLFKEEKELNERMVQLDDTLLKAKENVVMLSSKLNVSGESESAKAINAIRELKGVHGTIEELCSFDSKYAVPIQVTLGNRMNYVVVNSTRDAANSIDYLKKNGLGRVSFIPLDKIRQPNPAKDSLKDEKGAVSWVIDLLEFDSKLQKAFEFVTQNTLLMRSLADAEKLIGEARMVTMDGELVEPTGLMTGGRVAERAAVSAVKLKKDLEEWNARLEESKKSKENTLARLQELRNETNVQRKKVASAELAQKTIEIELDHVEAEQKAIMEKQKNIADSLKQLEKEVEELDESIAKGDGERGELIRQLSNLNVKALEAKQRVDLEKEEKLGSLVKEKEKKIAELKIRMAEYTNALETLKTQYSYYEKEMGGYNQNLSEVIASINNFDSNLKANAQKIKENEVTLKEKIAEQKKVSSAMKGLLEQREAVEQAIAKAQVAKGKLEFEREKLEKESQEQQLKRVALETRLTDLKANYAEYAQAEILTDDIEKRPELLAELKQVDGEISALGQVNLRAIDLYDERMKEFEQQSVRVKQFYDEKESVITLIREIEAKKVGTFMQTFEAINANFTRLFSRIFKGTGELYLEKENSKGEMRELSEWGLTIRLQLETKEIKYLELMSGGEKSLIALVFLFALQMYSPSSVYILDEADAALDQENSLKLIQLLKSLSGESQFLVVTHNESIYKYAHCLVGVAMGADGSKIVEVKLSEEKPAPQ